MVYGNGAYRSICSITNQIPLLDSPCSEEHPKTLLRKFKNLSWYCFFSFRLRSHVSVVRVIYLYFNLVYCVLNVTTKLTQRFQLHCYNINIQQLEVGEQFSRNGTFVCMPLFIDHLMLTSNHISLLTLEVKPTPKKELPQANTQDFPLFAGSPSNCLVTQNRTNTLCCTPKKMRKIQKLKP